MGVEIDSQIHGAHTVISNSYFKAFISKSKLQKLCNMWFIINEQNFYTFDILHCIRPPSHGFTSYYDYYRLIR
ncbi:hypothetical protein D3C71_2177250 [compost metagenome]